MYGYNNNSIIAIVENARNNQVYYSNFEDDATATNCVKNPRRQKVKQGGLEIKVAQLKPGKYRISYLCSSDNGQRWIRKNQPLELSGLSSEVVSNVNTFSDIPDLSELIQSYPTHITVGETGELIDELQIIPEESLIVTANYIPGVGKISETDHNGLTYYYDYDELGRLIRILDGNEVILKEYKYYIAP